MQAITDYLRQCRARGLRPETIRVRRQILTTLHDDIGNLLEADLDDLTTWLLKYERKSQWTRCTYAAALRAFYGWAIDTELLERNPATHLPSPRAPRGRPRPMPLADLHEAIRHAPDQRLTAWLTLGGYAGLRAGEIARLRREDVNARSTPHLIEVINGKGGRDRTVIVGNVVTAALSPYLAVRGPLWDRSPHTVSTIISSYFRDLGMPWTAHTLRHTYATNLYSISHDIRLTQDQLGHSSPATTAIYAKVSPQSALLAVQGLDDLAALPTAS